MLQRSYMAPWVSFCACASLAWRQTGCGRLALGIASALLDICTMMDEA